ncbi:hypothetical protein TCDM_10427 [Trypanosoma cruzi Dm28c]|uniref:Uncharacterized protein n=1 Tax=Trypanosoma cruzi Dm28c TaxID=1416333 RepID=V5B2X2_TRYCR|nr:hypothetical protein TCDM_10427 [Trypanosoma cruzi Dm28c]
MNPGRKAAENAARAAREGSDPPLPLPPWRAATPRTAGARASSARAGRQNARERTGRGERARTYISVWADGRVPPHCCKRTGRPGRFCLFLVAVVIVILLIRFYFHLYIGVELFTCFLHKESIYLFRSTMSDVAMYDEELKGLEEQISSLLRALDSATNLDQRLEKYNKAQDIMKRLHKTHHQFKVEVRLLEGNEQEVYEKRGQIHLLRINQLKMDLQSKKVEETPFSAARENSVFSSNSPSQ